MFDELRMIQARQARAKPDESSQAGPESPASAGSFEGLPELVQAVRAYQARAAQVDKALDDLCGRDGVSKERLARLNKAIAQVERAFSLGGGLPGRPWFKHSIYAPGVTTGYGAWPLPAVRQVLEEKKPERLTPAGDRDGGQHRQGDRRACEGSGRRHGPRRQVTNESTDRGTMRDHRML